MANNNSSKVAGWTGGGRRGMEARRFFNAVQKAKAERAAFERATIDNGRHLNHAAIESMSAEDLAAAARWARGIDGGKFVVLNSLAKERA